MCANHSTIGAIIADLGNFEIPTLCLTGKRSSSELQVQLSVSPNSHLILTYLNFASFKVSATYVGPTGIEPVPLVLQTSVRTSYTKDPYTLRWYLPFLKSTLSPCLFYLSVLPYWVPEANTLWAAVDSNHPRKGPILQTGCRIRTTFATQFAH